MTVIPAGRPAPPAEAVIDWTGRNVPPQVSWRPDSRPARATVSAKWPGRVNVLAIITRPGQESAELGALLYALSHAGATLTLLTMSRGEASRANSTAELLETIRPRELQIAAAVLGVTSVAVGDCPDGRLAALPPCQLTERVARAILAAEADLLLVLDPATPCRAVRRPGWRPSAVSSQLTGSHRTDGLEHSRDDDDQPGHQVLV
jgi:GlcNAc-PI de-N-acetylase